jgi:hypothetical protein
MFPRCVLVAEKVLTTQESIARRFPAERHLPAKRTIDATDIASETRAHFHCSVQASRAGSGPGVCESGLLGFDAKIRLSIWQKQAGALVAAALPRHA